LKQQKPTTIKELCEFIWYLEDKYDLLNFQIYDVKVWQYARMRIYYFLAKKLNILKEPQVKLNTYNKISSVIQYIKNSFTANPLFSKKSDILILPHPRVKKIDNHYIDIYTYYLKEDLLKQNYKVVEIESAYKGLHKREKDQDIYYDDFIRLMIKGIKLIPFYYQVHNSIVQEIEKDIVKITGVKIDLQREFSLFIKEYKVEAFFYKKILQKVKPKQIYLSVSYGKGALIKVARELGIETIELQHGTFSRYHLGYSFSCKKLDYFPDKFYVWSDFWKNLIPLPLDKQNIVIYEFAHMKNQLSKYKKKLKKPFQVVVLSQGAIGEEIARMILKNIVYFKNFSIKYKLHPGEYERWQEYPSLVQLVENYGVELIKDCDLYELLSTSSYQIGVFSTAIYEGLEFGCKTILLNITGIEYMQDILEQKRAFLYKEGTYLHEY
jgi:hypothetical protein